MLRPKRPFRSLLIGAIVSSFLPASLASAYVPIATANLVTNTKGGRNEMPSVDKKGGVVVFVSHSDHVNGVSTPATGTFDFDNTGNDYATGAAPSPSCPNCTSVDNGDGNLYLWRLKKKGAAPANSVTQLTFSNSGGFSANEFPEIDQKAQWVVWNSRADHTGGNADGNSEIFMVDLRTLAITQITETTGDGSRANRTATITDKGIVVFDSTRDFAAAGTCRRPDGVSACSNGDGNSEVMIYDSTTGDFTQVTDTVGDGTDAQRYPRVSVDGNFIVFQSTRDFSGALTGGVSCIGLDGVTPCSNDTNGEIMMYDVELRQLTQVTNTIEQSGCNSKDSNRRPEVSKKGKYIVFQSECEDQLNPTGCGDCGGSANNQEVFLVDKRKAQVSQVTISHGGWNRSPRINATGKYIAFDTNRNYLGLNSTHSERLYILKRSSTKQTTGLTARMQVEEDPVLQARGIQQHPRVQATTIGFFGGFPGSERIGMSGNGRIVAFESSKDVGNQEIWRVDRARCTHGFPDCR